MAREQQAGPSKFCNTHYFRRLSITLADYRSFETLPIYLLSQAVHARGPGDIPPVPFCSLPNIPLTRIEHRTMLCSKSCQISSHNLALQMPAMISVGHAHLPHSWSEHRSTETRTLEISALLLRTLISVGWMFKSLTRALHIGQPSWTFASDRFNQSHAVLQQLSMLYMSICLYYFSGTSCTRRRTSTNGLRAVDMDFVEVYSHRPMSPQLRHSTTSCNNPQFALN